MKLKFVLLIIILVLFSNSILAQNVLDRIGLSSTSASVAYSLRLLSNSYTGPLVRIKVNTSFYDVYPDATTKNFSVNSKISAAITNYNDAVVGASSNALSSIITSSTNATVAVLYDQSGYGIHVYASAATAKIITLGNIITMNGQPTITFVSSSSLVSTLTVNYSAQTAATINAVAQNLNSTSDYSGIISTGENGGWGISYNPNTNTQQVYQSGNPTGTYLYGYFVDGSGGLNASSKELTTSPKIVTGLINKSTTTSSIYINSTLKNSNTSLTFVNPNNGTADKIFFGQRGNFSNRNFLGNISEAIIFSKNLTATEQSALESSQAIYIPPFVEITASTSGTICPGTNVVFTATTTNIVTPTFQWYNNGVAIPGATSSRYSSSTFNNNDKITVKATPATASASIVNGINLKANLDAGNASSYSGSGITWTDLTGNGNKVTLTGTGYTNVNGGGITFNTISTYGTQTFPSPPFNSDFTWSSIYKASPISGNGWDRLYSTGVGTNYNGFHVGHVNGKPAISFENWYPGGSVFNTDAEDPLTPGNYYMLTVVRSGNLISTYVQTNIYGNGATVSGASIPVTPIYIGKGPDSNPWENGVMNLMLIYDKALSPSDIVQNFNFYASRFGYGFAGYPSNSITLTVAPTVPMITLSGEACINKATLTTPSGLSSYAWYKNNVLIPGATSNSYSPSTIGSFQVQVSNGTCTNTSVVTTIYNCVVNLNGKIVASSNTNASLINSPEGGTNFGTGKDISGKLSSTIGLTTTVGSISFSTAILGGVISPTNAITTSIGVTYSTNINFSTYSSTLIQSNIGAGTYTCTISGLVPATTYYAKSFIINKADTSYGSIVSFTILGVGVYYQGGKIAYIFQSGDPGYVAGETHGLIAAEFDQSSGIQWYNGSYTTTSALGTALGTGNNNTNTIVSNQGGGTYAAQLCADLVLNGYSDWYLPSKDELNNIYLNKSAVGGFSNANYWSSSEYSSSKAWYQDFGGSGQGYLTKNFSSYVRAVRSF